MILGENKVYFICINTDTIHSNMNIISNGIPKKSRGLNTVVSRYLEFQGALRNASRYLPRHIRFAELRKK